MCEFSFSRREFICDGLGYRRAVSGAMFITLEDETDTASVGVSPDLLERQRRLVPSAGVLGVYGEIQREGNVIRLVVTHRVDLSPLLRQRRRARRHHPARCRTAAATSRRLAVEPDSRDPRWRRDIYVPDLHVKPSIRVRPRDFR